MGVSSTLIHADTSDKGGQRVQAVRVWICVEDGPGVNQEVKDCLMGGR